MKTFKYRAHKGRVLKHFNDRQYDAKGIVLTWHAFLRAVEKKEIHGFAVEGVHDALPVSRFATLDLFRPRVRSQFMPLALREFRADVARITKPAKIETIGDISLSKFAQPKARQKLSLKAKVALPIAHPVTKDSAGKDLATVFRKEMDILTRAREAGIDIAPITKNGPVIEKRRAQPQPKKWADLVSERAQPAPQTQAERAPEKTADRRFDPSKFDLATAFKMEMQALLEEQARGLGPMPSSAPSLSPRRVA